MAGNKLTHAEHSARAMLLGRVYDWRDGTYCIATGQRESLSPHKMMDAVTLEWVDSVITVGRMDKWGTINAKMGSKPEPTPYCDE